MLGYAPLFVDRTDAGRRLAARLATLKLDNPVVYALPRGGVPVAVEIGKALRAPVDLLLVRKIGAPGAPELALAAVIDGDEAQIVVNEDVRRLTGGDARYLEQARRVALEEIERRRAVYEKGRPHVSPAGRTAIVVDDGLATGATAKAALLALRRRGAARVVLAVPVAPIETLREMRRETDDVVCLEPAEHFRGVGAFYSDFRQLTDADVLAALREAETGASQVSKFAVRIPPLELGGDLQVPARVKGVVLFAHGSGSSRHSPRNRAVADTLNKAGFATLLMDLLSDQEAADRRNVFDIDLLAERLVQAVEWLRLRPELAEAPLGLFGASTGAAAALKAAASLGDRVSAVVSRGGRPDLAGADALGRVTAATLLIVGGADTQVIGLNREALAELRCRKALTLVPKAGHLFEEPGALDEVMRLATDWFGQHSVAAHGGPAAGPPTLTAAARLRAAMIPLAEIDDVAFAEAFDRYADRRIVMLGEASHGTSEFYRARAAITRRLIERHGFSAVAFEADWPDMAAVDRRIRAKPRQTAAAKPFSRFPTWMWRNAEFEAFANWAADRNSGLVPDQKAAFYGLDLYSLRASMAAVLEYLDRVDPEAARAARDRYACLAPWSADPPAYGMDALRRGYALCEAPVLSTLRDMAAKAFQYASQDEELFFDAAQNARVVADAERYYRAMYFGARESWNLRDRHMFETLERVMRLKGKDSKVVVWAHNSHIGDARFTDMGAERDEINIGQLARERFGNDVALVGFGTHGGTVMAADDWDGPGKAMAVQPSRTDSYERLFHETSLARGLLDLRRGRNEAVRQDLRDPRLERYIGVVYRPATELVSHYARSSLPDQFDGFAWFDETRAVQPLSAQEATVA